MMQNFF